MQPSQTPRALILWGAALTLTYGAGYGIWLVAGAPLWSSSATEPSGDTQTARAPTTAYEVTAQSGETFVMRLSTRDPALVLVEAAKRFGEPSEVKRVDADEIAIMMPAIPAAETGAAVGSGTREGLGQPAILAGSVMLLPLGFLLVGARLQQREQRVQRLWSSLDPNCGGDVDAIQEQTGLSSQGLRLCIASIARRQWADLEWDRVTRRIVDRRMSMHAIDLRHCPACNQPVNDHVRADLRAVGKCPHCARPYDRVALLRIIEPVAEQVKADARKRLAQRTGFSWAIFGALALYCHQSPSCTPTRTASPAAGWPGLELPLQSRGCPCTYSRTSSSSPHPRVRLRRACSPSVVTRR